MPADTVPAPARQFPALAGFLAASVATWLLAAVPIRFAGGWFAGSLQAPWMPPGWMFRSLWMVLYAGVAVAAWLVWRRGALHGSALAGYCAQLALNAAWPAVFFGLYPRLGAPALWAAFAVIIALAASLAFLTLRFGPASRIAGLLLLPYFSWVVFSATLNLYSAIHN